MGEKCLEEIMFSGVVPVDKGFLRVGSFGLMNPGSKLVDGECQLPNSTANLAALPHFGFGNVTIGDMPLTVAGSVVTITAGNYTLEIGSQTMDVKVTGPDAGCAYGLIQDVGHQAVVDKVMATLDTTRIPFKPIMDVPHEAAMFFSGNPILDQVFPPLKAVPEATGSNLTVAELTGNATHPSPLTRIIFVPITENATTTGSSLRRA